MAIDVSGISFARGTGLALPGSAWLRSACEKMQASIKMQGAARARSGVRANNGAPSGVAVILRSLSGAVALARSGMARTHADKPAMPAIAMPSEMSTEKQWVLVTSVVGSFVSHAEATARAQNEARQQVAAARYALDELVRELHGSMVVDSLAASKRVSSRTITSPVVQVLERPSQGMAA